MKNIYLAVIIAIILVIRVTPAAAFSLKMIPAKAAVVMDDSGTVLYAKHPNAKLAPASTVKLITAMVALDNLDPAKKVKISRNAGTVRSIKPRIHPDEEMTVSDLLHLALMKSINSAAVALAEATAGSEQDFVMLMNRKAKEIGANNTLFANASGLPKGTQYTTASDLALILKHALSYPLIREILGTKEYLIRTSEGRDIFLDNTDDLLWQRDNVIGGKTGYTGNARHCFVCAINTDKGPFFTAVLGARSRSSLWRSTLMLAELGMNPELAYAMEKPRRIRKTSRRAATLEARRPVLPEAGSNEVIPKPELEARRPVPPEAGSNEVIPKPELEARKPVPPEAGSNEAIPKPELEARKPVPPEAGPNEAIPNTETQ